MTQNKQNGGPAFPRDGEGEYDVSSQKGMSLRDYFAGKVLQGMCVYFKNPLRERINESDDKCLAEHAYKVADAMLKAREE